MSVNVKSNGSNIQLTVPSDIQYLITRIPNSGLDEGGENAYHIVPFVKNNKIGLTFTLSPNTYSWGWAFIVGRRNGANGVLNASVSAMVNTNDIDVYPIGTLSDKWIKVFNVKKIQLPLEDYSSGIVIYGGFTSVTIE